MRTFDAYNGDISFRVVDGLDSVMQRVAQRLRFRLGEWFLRTDKGTDYAPILGSYGIDDLAVYAFTQEAASVEGVERVSDVKYFIENETRVFRYTAVVTTAFGSDIVTVEV